jgi:hypothetical protein
VCSAEVFLPEAITVAALYPQKAVETSVEEHLKPLQLQRVSASSSVQQDQEHQAAMNPCFVASRDLASAPELSI